MPSSRWLSLVMGLWIAASSHADVRFVVTVPAGKLDAPRDGRVVVYLAGPDKGSRHGEETSDWDYCHDPMPLYAVDVKGLSSGATVKIDPSGDWFRTKLNDLPPGEWQAQAVFDWQSQASAPKMEPGDLMSRVVTFEVKAGEPSAVTIPLDRVVKARTVGSSRAELVEVRSKLLSDFAHHDVYLRAGIALPIDYKPDGKYAAIYEVPGFGGDRYDAADESRERAVRAAVKDDSPARELATKTFHVYLDPESPNGHTLFADSDVNGPYGQALVKELIPAIEAKYPALVAEPRGRLLTGHSSGGWSVCYLQTHFDDFFGGAWPSSPDPVDFRKFERIDLYAADNFYASGGEELPSVRERHGKVTLHVREENAWEQTVAPDNTGGLQWQSWQAVFGLPRGDGHARPLYDIHTGAIDKSQLDHYRKYDLCEQLKADPKQYAPIWREKIRLIVGTSDDYYLNEAVALLRDELAKLPPPGTQETNKGYITIVPGKTHDTIYGTPEMAKFDKDMLEVIDGK